jgi:hypothetical protein
MKCHYDQAIPKIQRHFPVIMSMGAVLVSAWLSADVHHAII